MKKKIKLYDSTLRDGAQTKGVNFSLNDKLKIISLLDEIGIDYIEGGWPGANPTDNVFFQNSRILHGIPWGGFPRGPNIRCK